MNTENLPKRGRPRDPERMRRVLEAGAAQFLEQGYERASMEVVAQAAGVSKMTLYNYFPSKEALLEACVASRTDDMFAAFLIDRLDPAQPAQALELIGRQFVALMRADDALRIHRIMYGLASTHPEICDRFHQAGPQRTIDLTREYLTSAVAVGSLDVDDTELAADQFLALHLGTPHVRATLGLGTPPLADDEHLVRENVKLFLARYGTVERAGRRKTP